MSPEAKVVATDRLIRLVDDITECPVCGRPNEVLRRADRTHRVVLRRTLSGKLHCHLGAAS